MYCESRYGDWLLALIVLRFFNIGDNVSEAGYSCDGHAGASKSGSSLSTTICENKSSQSKFLVSRSCVGRSCPKAAALGVEYSS